jgi:ParB family transcriptional regulator, chromosome partitioning protein
MMSRKEQLKALFEPGTGHTAPERLETQAAHAPSAEPPKRAPAGAVKAMGLSLGNLTREISEARRLAQNIADGERVIEIDPAKIDPSPVSDRLSRGALGDESYVALVESLKTNGQQVPVLVRPHPDPAKAQQGWFQSAYGHRRIRAASEIGQPVKAIVRPLNDAELVMAQGKENAERRDLSFIEKAFFAKAMLEQGFDRPAAQQALAVDKTEMSRLLQVADAIPQMLARAIGPAPKAGRPRWMALGALLVSEAAQHKAQDETHSPAFQAAETDRRFALVFDRLSRRTAPEAAGRDILSGEGAKIASVWRKGNTTLIEVPEGRDEGFAAFLAAQLPALLPPLLAAFRKKASG